mmetsp:Transcript_49/g.99  ORF Transcript_49/g.99 Transcript_49/m.99 type:complete len:203 (-) Transcript_49:953-1561(-)
MQQNALVSFVDSLLLLRILLEIGDEASAFSLDSTAPTTYSVTLLMSRSLSSSPLAPSLVAISSARVFRGLSVVWLEFKAVKLNSSSSVNGNRERTATGDSSTSEAETLFEWHCSLFPQSIFASSPKRFFSFSSFSSPFINLVRSNSVMVEALLSTVDKVEESITLGESTSLDASAPPTLPSTSTSPLFLLSLSAAFRCLRFS